MNMKRTIAATLLAASLLAGVIVPASAAPRTAVINVAYGIALEFNEQEVQLTDAKGRKVEPFVSNGTTYVPLRAVSELFGAGVGYEESLHTAYIYDDFSEAVSIVYSMYRAVDYCLDTAESDYHSAMQNDFSYYKDNYSNGLSMLDARLNALNKARTDNKNIELIDKYLTKDFNSFVATYKNVYSSLAEYEKYGRRNTSLLDNIQALVLQNYTFTIDSDRFFADYCNWRDLGLFD